MPTSVVMPELGESIVEGTIVRWLKNVGESVAEDEPIVEIMTDKVNTELPAPATGIMQQILAKEGETVLVGQELAVISEDGVVAKKSGPPPIQESEGFYADSAPAPAPTPAAAPVVAAPAANKGSRRYSPLVSRMAKDHGLSEAELSGLSGTGSGGRVSKRDLVAYLEGRKAPSFEAPRPVVVGEGDEIIPFTGLRKVIADKLTHSYQTLVHVTTVMQADVTKLVEFRDRNKESFQAQFGVRLTYSPFFLKAVTEALVEYPMMNASIEGDKIIVHKYVNLGVAVALGAKGEGGLVVPVIRDAHKKSLIDLAKDLEELAKKARESRITTNDLMGGTFTVTNTGTYGALIGTPIINAPQSAVMGTYAIVKQPVAIDDMIAIRSMMNLCMSYDHRLIDGMYAGQFLKRVKSLIEEFDFFK
ncbi:MAG: 2-oxo acid dehydrogenase subunit E2 [Armatimonadetes bacterium]|nr:2-oxo acid dehydrogenase subunit E2 [Armatimonadota bacterium]